jgi:hypothetical protein
LRYSGSSCGGGLTLLVELLQRLGSLALLAGLALLHLLGDVAAGDAGVLLDAEKTLVAIDLLGERAELLLEPVVLLLLVGAEIALLGDSGLVDRLHFLEDLRALNAQLLDVSDRGHGAPPFFAGWR